MIKSKIKLIIFILDNETFRYRILSINEEKVILPYLEIEKYLNLEEGIKHLISLYIPNQDVAQYCNLKLTDIDIGEEVDIYYYTFIPHDTEVTNSYKIPLVKYECNLPNIQKIIRSLVQ